MPTGESSRATSWRRTRALARSPVGAGELAVVAGAVVEGAAVVALAAGAPLRSPLEQPVATSTTSAATTAGPRQDDGEDWVRIRVFSRERGACVGGGSIRFRGGRGKPGRRRRAEPGAAGPG